MWSLYSVCSIYFLYLKRQHLLFKFPLIFYDINLWLYIVDFKSSFHSKMNIINQFGEM